jgi:hypothetical protein
MFVSGNMRETLKPGKPPWQPDRHVALLKKCATRLSTRSDVAFSPRKSDTQRSTQLGGFEGCSKFAAFPHGLLKMDLWRDPWHSC